MVIKRLLLTWVTVLFVVLGGEVNAQSPQADFRSLDSHAQLLKAEGLKLNRDLRILRGELLYPAATHVAVFLSVDAAAPLALAAVELRIDDNVVTNHRYAEGELNALFRGGVHRLYTGNLPVGQHDLTALVTGRGANGKEYRKGASILFHKRSDAKFIELKIVKAKGKQLPEVLLPGSAGYHRPGGIEDPHFGEVLFDLYRGKYFSATTGLMAAQKTQTLQRHEHEAALLLGDLYLSYGLHRKAGRLFARVIAGGAPPDVAARTRFHLAKDRYQRGYMKDARDVLLRSRDTLSMEMQDERRILLALVLMKQNRYGEAVAILRQLRGKSAWATYARYNIGVGLIQVGRQKEGVAVLEKIARMRARKSEMKALRDKANLALGFTLLSLQEPGRAKSYFRDVRLNGPFTNRALLGIGWALSAKGKHKQSLAPWMELQERNDIDVAVQESLLAVPYALSKLEAYKQALRHYENAITVYNAEIGRLEQIIESLRTGELLPAVVSAPASESGGNSAGEKLPDTPENRYLIHLFASHDFHQALKSYRDMQALSQNLECLSANMDAYNSMLELWRRGDEERQQGTAATHEGTAALAALDVHDPPNPLESTRKQTGGVTDVPVSNQQEKCGRVVGFRHWQISADYTPRLWSTNTGNSQRRQGITIAKSQGQSLQHSQQMTGSELDGFSARITAFHRRISQLQVDVDRVARAHERYLQELVAEELERQKEQLRSYVTQARFGIARVYDQSSSRAEKAQ